jgi:hypothetical protein
MKIKSIAYIFMAVTLIALTGCAAGSGAQINTPVPNTMPGTPTPEGQINVPGVSIQVPGITFQLNIPGVNPLVNQADTHGRVAGIVTGIWHGLISPVTLVVSFINKDVQMYEVHNDGSPYNLGFLIGVGLVFLLLGALAGSSRR